MVQYIEGAYDSRATLAPMVQYMKCAIAAYSSNVSKLALIIWAIKEARASDWIMPTDSNI